MAPTEGRIDKPGRRWGCRCGINTIMNNVNSKTNHHHHTSGGMKDGCAELVVTVTSSCLSSADTVDPELAVDSSLSSDSVSDADSASSCDTTAATTVSPFTAAALVCCGGSDLSTVQLDGLSSPSDVEEPSELITSSINDDPKSKDSCNNRRNLQLTS